MLSWYQMSKVCVEDIPRTITAPPAAWNTGRMDPCLHLVYTKLWHYRLNETQTIFPVLCWPICWSSSASMCWPFRDTLLHTMIVMSSYFSYCCLSISLNLPNLLWHQTRDFCPESCCLLDIFFFMDHPLQRCLCWKILADLQFLKYSNQPIWLTAMPHLK